MISRRDKLLVRPWEQRRYEYHRRKVQSAIPAIDVGPPANRVHVSYKLKKHQKEIERCDKIEKDNLKLLQRLRSLMSSSRVDNTWTTAQPNFLNKVAIYDTNNKLMYGRKESPSLSFDEKTRKGRCIACTPKKPEPPKIPEPRIPWAPPKSPVSHKRSKSVPPRPRRVQISETQGAPEPSKDSPPRKNSLQTSSTSSNKSTPAPLPRLRSRSSRSVDKPRLQTPTIPTQSQSIVLSRGAMHLAVSFPPDTTVKLKNGKREKFLIDTKTGMCQCKAIRY